LPVLSGAAMRAADQEAETRYHISSVQLMEVAGFQLARFVNAFLEGARGREVLVVAGAGNNGGDALVAARLLHARGASVSIRLSSGPPRGLGAGHLQTAESLGLPISPLLPLPSGGLSAAVVIDGNLGTGIRLPLRADAAKAVAALNAASLPVIAVDVPSGLDADTGAGEDGCVRATATLTLGLAKPALRSSQAAGRVYVADIGLPPSLFGVEAEAVNRLFDQDTIVEVID
jgi:NAD(P)H-hydrate epimerase